MKATAPRRFIPCPTPNHSGINVAHRPCYRCGYFPKVALEVSAGKASLSLVQSRERGVMEPSKALETFDMETGELVITCNCAYQNDPYKAPEMHPMTCPVWLLAAERWFDGDGSEHYFGAGHQDKDEFAAWVNEEGEDQTETITGADVVHAWAIPAKGERFAVVKEPTDGAIPITVFRT